MYPRSFFVAFLTLSSLTAQAAPASNHDQSECSLVQAQTVYQTVTVTVSSTAPTPGSTTNNNDQSTSGSSSSSSSHNSNPTHQNNTDDNSNNGRNNSGKNTNNNNDSNASSTTTASTATNTNIANTTSNSGDNTGVDAAQTSLTLDPRVIAKGFKNNGQDVPNAGQVPSLTSTNNFINFCLTVPDLPITDGKQITTGSCNPAPIGVIPSTDNMPSAKFSSPKNFATIKANTAFTIEMNIQGMETGFFVNADKNYFAAPQQLNAQGQIKGHSHVVIEQLDSLEQTTPTDPQKFAFFKGLNSAASNGKLTADVTLGLPAGVYRLASINTNANHAPAIVPVAQHGSLDDVIYFTVTEDGNPVVGAASPATGSVAASSTLATSAKVRTSTSASKFKTVSVSVTGITSASTSATKVASFTAVSSTTQAFTNRASADKASSTITISTDKASITEIPSTPASKDASSAASPTATEEVAAGASLKVVRDLRLRRRWNFGDE